MKRNLILALICALWILLFISGSAAAGEVLYETTFSDDDFTWDDWETELDYLWEDRGPLGAYWTVEDGAFTIGWDRQDVQSEAVFLKDGYDWEDYRVEMEVEIVNTVASWVFRAETVEDYELYELAAGDPGVFWVWPRLWGSYQWRYNAELDMEILLETVYDVVIEVEGPVVRHYIDGVLVEEFDEVLFERGTFGFRVWPGADGDRHYRIHSLRITEL